MKLKPPTSLFSFFIFYQKNRLDWSTPIYVGKSFQSSKQKENKENLMKRVKETSEALSKMFEVATIVKELFSNQF